MLTQERLREKLDYDSANGLFRWRAGSSRRFFRGGEIAGRPDKDGYVCIRVANRTYRAATLAWFYVYGKWPSDELDHINGIPADNSIANLREATRGQQRANSRIARNNTSGFKGVTRVLYGKQGYKWRAQLGGKERTVYLGFFDNPEDAHVAYLEAASQKYGEFAFSGNRGG